jgi:hypothetical protein
MFEDGVGGVDVVKSVGVVGSASPSRCCMVEVAS